MSEAVTEWVRVSEWVSGWVSVWVSEVLSEWVSEWGIEWMSDWVSDIVIKNTIFVLSIQVIASVLILRLKIYTQDISSAIASATIIAIVSDSNFGLILVPTYIPH